MAGRSAVSATVNVVGRKGGRALNRKNAGGLFAAIVLMGIVALAAAAPTRAVGRGASPSAVIDEGSIPPTPTAVSSVKTCSNGMQMLLGSVCPAPMQMCNTGELIYLTQVCPAVAAAMAATPVAVPADNAAGATPVPAADAGPTLTLCGAASSFNPATQFGVMSSAITVGVGQVVLCGASFAAGPGCQPAGEAFDFGDGSQPLVSGQFQGASHAYGQPGVYGVTDTIANCPAPAPASVTVVPVAGMDDPSNLPQQALQNP
jgi:hypothetical protein